MLLKNSKLKGKDGVSEIHVGDEKKEVFCDMTTDEGGWTVIQKRINGCTDFYKTWSEYKKGFGNPNTNYWIGNDAIHILTEKKEQVLRVQLLSFDGEEAHAVYSNFHVGDEDSEYKLTVSGYNGTAGDSLDLHDGMTFATKDRDFEGCAVEKHGAWWYTPQSCHYSNLNGEYAGSALLRDRYMVWYHWKSKFVALKGTSMMVRPNKLGGIHQRISECN
ncbi:ficolin-1-like [Ostrea edulis]|uniref:ficolin-1-like n=1 Tax=Ostrea edulis TaxID=37623 RepID=UPI0024AFEA47|nr:ficolin-1-like [Ostrea edulis]